MKQTNNLWAVILAGGFGTRFWPASRQKFPKQFLAVAGKRTLIAETSERLGKLVPIERQLVVTSQDHVALVHRFLKKIPKENVLAEPLGRNTAACVAWAAREIGKRDPHAIQAILPSDHIIRPSETFRAALGAAAAAAADSDALFTFGIRPTFPATGYGYIECGKREEERDGYPVHAVKRFVEKPDRARAEKFVESGNFLWNSGMFVWSTRAITQELERSTPELWSALSKAKTSQQVIRAYPSLPSVSVDVAIMEKARAVRVVPIDFQWSDVGSWSAIPDVAELDPAGNCVAGGTQLLIEDARGCIAYGKSGDLIALLGVENLIVVQAGKAVLVCPKDRAQDVKKIVTRLEREAPGYL
jgi:mannose-1-phosphate guanylyltransferase